MYKLFAWTKIRGEVILCYIQHNRCRLSVFPHDFFFNSDKSRFNSVVWPQPVKLNEFISFSLILSLVIKSMTLPFLENRKQTQLNIK